MNRQVGIPVFLCLLALPMNFVAVASPEVGKLHSSKLTSLDGSLISIAQGRMTVKIQQASLSRVLETIANKSGIRIVSRVSYDETVSIQFKSVAIEDGLRLILNGRNAAYFYAAKFAGSKKPPLVTLTEVYLLGGAPRVSVETGSDRRLQKEQDAANFGGDDHGEASAELMTLADQLLKSHDAQSRKEAAEGLGKLRSPEAVGPLSRALFSDKEPAVRSAIAEALGKTWSEDAVQPLSEAILQDNDAAVREAAARALGTTWSENAVEALILALSNDSDPLVREQAARALGKTAGAEAAAPLVSALLRDPRRYVREAAARALGSIDGGSIASEGLEYAMQHDPDRTVRESAARSVRSTAN